MSFIRLNSIYFAAELLRSILNIWFSADLNYSLGRAKYPNEIHHLQSPQDGHALRSAATTFNEKAGSTQLRQHMKGVSTDLLPLTTPSVPRHPSINRRTIPGPEIPSSHFFKTYIY